MKSNVGSLIVKNNLCCSCGICKVVCPQDCISPKRLNGEYNPEVDEEKCSECGACLDICSGYQCNLKAIYEKQKQPCPENYYVGNNIASYVGYALDDKTRENGVSGGCITAMVKGLLDMGEYDVAFLVDSYDYSDFLETKPFRKNDLLTDTPKSRYVPVSHGSAIKYILNNRDEKVIFVGTSCAVQSFLTVLSKYHLKRENYLVLGLFCDKTMSYNIYNYFSDYYKTNSDLKKLHFRTKEREGWPGIVKLEYENGDSLFLPILERAIVKDYFQLERCLYCVDKLNQFADISIGDNYTGKDSSKLGSNSLIIRTKEGKIIIDKTKELIEVTPVEINDICTSQHINSRVQNYQYALLKEKSTDCIIYEDSPFVGTTIDQYTVKQLDSRLHLINLGRSYCEKSQSFHKMIRLLKMKRSVVGMVIAVFKKLKGLK